jgi:hypothetical protein
MADFSSFNANYFKTSEWVNQALKNRNEEESLEAYLAQLAMKLHIISQDFTDELESGIILFS